MLRTASIKLDVMEEQTKQLAALQAAYTDACNRLVPVVRAHRVWNRVALHNLAYTRLRSETPLPSQMCCNAIFTVCKAYKAQKALNRIKKDEEVPLIEFRRASVHFDKRTYTIKGETLSLATLSGRIVVPMRLGEHQRRILASGVPKEAELVFRKGKWFFNLAEALRIGASRIVMEDLTHIRDRIKAGRRMRARLHGWAWRQLQTFIDYKARAAGIEVVYVDPSYTSQTCSRCGAIGKRTKHRFVCQKCGLRAHADCNASRNLARIGETAVSPRAAVNTPYVGDEHHLVLR